MPVQGEYKGVASPVVQLIGRRGQPLYWDPFSNTGGNYNVAVIGKSGSGKSVFMQELVTSLRGTGCKTFVIDDGRSFMNTCLLQGGRFVYFAAKQNSCLNPFSLLSENDSEDKIEDIKVDAKGETKGVADEVFRRLPEEIVKNQTLNVILSYKIYIICFICEKPSIHLEYHYLQ